MLILISLLSVFVPFEATEDPVVFPFAEYDFRLFCTKTPTVVALIVSDTKSKEDKKAIERFSNAILEFSDHAYFLIFNRSQVPQLNSRFQYKKPYMVLINRAQLSLNCEIPEDDLSLATTIHFWTTSLRYTAKSADELFELLGPTKYALILREIDINDGFRILSTFIADYGSTEIISATDNVFEQINMKNEKFLLFRRDDNSISPLSPQFNLPVNSIDETNHSLNYTAMIETAKRLGMPNYSRLENQDLNYQNYTFLGLVYNTENAFTSTPSISTINNNISAVLENLHNIAPEFRVVLVENEFFNIVESITHQEIENTPDLIAFNYKMRYYYPNSGSFKNLTFGSDGWQKNAKEYVEMIREGIINPKYESENGDSMEQTHNKVITAVVGSNFEQFVNDPENDVMMIFRSKNDKESQITTELSSTFGLNDKDFIKFSEEILHSLENTQYHLKIGIIDPTLNSSPRGFPYFFNLPHVELYLHDKKDQSRPMFSRVNRNSILRFLKANNIDHNIPVKNLTFNEALREMESIVSNFSKMPGEAQVMAESYVSKVLEPIVDFNPFNSPFGMTPEEIVEMKKNARNSQWFESIDNLQKFTINT